MALRDFLIVSETLATAATSVRRGEEAAVAKVAGVAVATPRKSNNGGKYEADTALGNTKTAGHSVPVAKATEIAESTIENSKDEEHNAFFAPENFATATPATPATPIPNIGKAVAKARDSKTGELMPRMLALVQAVQSDTFVARLGSFRSKSNPQEIQLVDIFCPARSGGMKGLTFRVDQLPGLIRALQSVQKQALERGLLSGTTGNYSLYNPRQEERSLNKDNTLTLLDLNGLYDQLRSCTTANASLTYEGVISQLTITGSFKRSTNIIVLSCVRVFRAKRKCFQAAIGSLIRT